MRRDREEAKLETRGKQVSRRRKPLLKLVEPKRELAFTRTGDTKFLRPRKKHPTFHCEPLPEDHSFGAVRFSDRKIGKQCAWIVGDPNDDCLCCGKPILNGSEYCEEHFDRAYVQWRKAAQ